LPEPPDEVLSRLRSHLVLVRSVWFPTQRELREWAASGSPLYVRPIGKRRVEVGPRLASLWAACFAPVDEIVFAESDGGTTLSVSRRFPRFTSGLLVVWWVLTVGWGVAVIPEVFAGRESPAWLLFWGILALSSTGGPAMGYVLGGRALDEGHPWLRSTLTTPDAGEDW
jgi:hypothetical protein